MRPLAAALLLSVAGVTGAADWTGTVSEIRVSTISPAVLFRLSGKLDNKARCNEYEMYAIDLNSPGGESVFELIKYAYLNGLTVQANSLRTCAVYWKAEGVKDITLAR